MQSPEAQNGLQNYYNFFKYTNILTIFCIFFVYTKIFSYLCTLKCAEMKRVLYIVGVFSFSVLLVFLMLVATLMSDRVQTAAVRWVTTEFAHALGTDAHIGEVHYHFPARVSIHDIYFEDLNHDTLLYVNEIYVHFCPMALLRDEIKFSHVHVNNAVSKLYRRDGVWNYQFFVEGLGLDKPSDSEPLQQLIAVHDIQFDSLRIDYDDYRMLLAHARMDLQELHLNTASLDAQVKELAMRITPLHDPSATPFEVKQLSAHFISNDSIFSLPTLKAQLARSRVDMGGIEMRYPAEDSLSLTEKAKQTPFTLHFREAQIVPADLSLFIPDVKGLNRPVALHGAVGGTMDSIRFQGIEVHYDGHPVLSGDLSLTNLSDAKKTYVRANLQEIQTNAARLQDFLSQLQNKPVQLPQPVHRLGTIHYKGLLSGRLHDMRLNGSFKTALGSITTSGTLQNHPDSAYMNYTAKIVGKDFKLGKLLDNPKLTAVTLDFDSKGQLKSDGVYGDIIANVQKLTYNNYTFNDLAFNGHYEPKLFEGFSSIDDPHIKASFEGVVKPKDNNPEINCVLQCHHFDLAPFTEDRDTTTRTSFKMIVDLSGPHLEELAGKVEMDSLFLATQYDAMFMENMTIVTSGAADKSKYISLKSDNLFVEVDGVFRYADLVPAFQSALHRYLPTAVPEPKAGWAPVAMNIRAEGSRLRQFQSLFEAPVVISDNSSMRADINISPLGGQLPFISFSFTAPGVRAYNQPIHDLSLSLNTVSDSLSFVFSAEVDHADMRFSTVAFRDSLLSRLTFRREPQQNWDSVMTTLTGRDLYDARLSQQRDGRYVGDMSFITRFSQYNRKPLIEMHFLQNDFLLRDSTYSMSDSYLAYCGADSWLQVDHFSLSGAGQAIRVNGMASTSSDDTLSIVLDSIDASYLIPFILPKQIITFNGYMTGEADVTGIFGHPQVETLIRIDSMGLNDCYFGEAMVDLHVTDSLAFHADVERPDRKVVNLDGKVDFNGGGWKLDMLSDRVPLDFINHWTSTVLDSLDGWGTGSIIVGGQKGGGVYVLLDVLAEDASLTLPWTGARYTIARDTIRMDTTAILFPDVKLTDAYGNPLELNGAIRHNQFKSYELDLHLDAYEALVFDSNNAGDVMQGSVFASGHLDVTGTDKDMLVAADMQTAKNSRFLFSLDNASSAYESNFIHFVQHAPKQNVVQEHVLDNIDIKRERKKAYYVPGGRCLLKLNIEANPLLLFQLIVGERNHDMIQARGAGAFTVRYDTQTEEVSLLGNYNMDQGSMSYTVGNVIRKDFTVASGSSIIFSGNPSNPQMNVTAKYRVTASLKDLFGDDISQLATTRTNIPVNTCMHMTGPLNNPIMRFSLEFPNSDQTVQQQVRDVINTDEMLMRQVIYLLVFGRFFAPENMSNMQNATLNSTYSILSSTVTGQINAWLSKLTNMFTLGVAIRTDGEQGDRSQEYEAQFQIMPVDRLVINGNFGYRYNDISNQPFFGDLDVEVLLTEDGQWRLKGYTHTVDKYSLRQASTIQGVGVMWKKDF